MPQSKAETTRPVRSPRPHRAAWLEELRAIATLSWPLILTNLTQIGMGTTDVVMMGWLGPEVLAAGALGSNLYFVAMIFGIGLLNAASPMIAHSIGKDRAGRDREGSEDVRRIVQQGFWAAVLVTVSAWCILWWSERLLLVMKQDAGLAAAAGTYVRSLQWALLPFLAYLVLRSFAGALERPGWSLVIGAGALLVNALGNWCLMLGKCGFSPIGIAGSGLATTLSSVLMFAAMAIVILRDRQFQTYQLFEAWWQTDWQRLRAFLALGLPMAATFSFEVTVFNAAVFLMGLIGPAALAAHAIAIQLAAISFMIPLGLGQAATIRVGLAHGARDSAGVARAGWVAFALGLAISTVASLAIVTFPLALIGLFLDTGDPKNAEVVALASTFLLVAALFQIADGAQAIGSGMLRGLQDARRPMLYALMGYWGIGLPLGVVLAFPLKVGGLGIWIGLAIGLAFVACLMIWRWTRREALGLIHEMPERK
jgi:multidrug resistance protein, MATE family